MPRPCRHSDVNLPTPGAPYVAGECRACFLFVSRADYRELWGGKTEDYPIFTCPGAHLTRLLASLGLEGDGCGGKCVTLARQMDAGGVEWCEAHRDEILTQLREAQASLGWGATLRAAALAVASGLAVRLDPLDPAPGLLDEAIRLTKEEATHANRG